MFAVSENMCMFVMPNNVIYTDNHVTYSIANKARSFSDNLISVRLRCLAKLPGGLASLLCTIINFFPKMPNNEKVINGEPNNSNLTVSEQYPKSISPEVFFSSAVSALANWYKYETRNILSPEQRDSRLIKELQALRKLNE